MMIGGGAFVRAAKSHEAAGRACQDTALVDIGETCALAIISDGCSAGHDSGISAALLAAAARSSWRGGASVGWAWGMEAWERVKVSMDTVGISAVANPSTLLSAELDGVSGDVSVALWGDGALVIIGAQGQVLEMWTGRSLLNRPAYPAYGFENTLWQAYEESGGGSTWTVESTGLPQVNIWHDAHGRFWQGAGHLKEGETLLLLSDGVEAVGGVSARCCVENLASAKGPGAFMERRVRKAILAWLSQGDGLGDDFSVAALRREQSLGANDEYS